MFTDKASLYLTGIELAIFFIAGIFDFLENPITITVIAVIFIAIVLNLFLVKNTSKEGESLLEKSVKK